jgi:hypothetical protein
VLLGLEYGIGHVLSMKDTQKASSSATIPFGERKQLECMYSSKEASLNCKLQHESQPFTQTSIVPCNARNAFAFAFA